MKSYKALPPQETTPLLELFQLCLAKREGLCLSLRLTHHNYQNLHVLKKRMHSLLRFDFPFSLSKIYVSANYTLIKWIEDEV